MSDRSRRLTSIKIWLSLAVCGTCFAGGSDAGGSSEA